MELIEQVIPDEALLGYWETGTNISDFRRPPLIPFPSENRFTPS
jgi:hypothetical protein